MLEILYEVIYSSTNEINDDLHILADLFGESSHIQEREHKKTNIKVLHLNILFPGYNNIII